MRQLPAPVRFLVLATVALATLATSCGDDTGADDATPDNPTSTDGAGDSSSTAPPDGTGGDTTTTMGDVERTASFRGVTPDAIKVGVVGPDLEALAGLVDLDHGSYEAAYRALIDDINATGGVNGRRIDMVYDAFLPIGTEGMDTICSRFTEDEQVFAVLGGLLDDGPLCYTELSDTAFIGSTQNDQRVERSSAPWFTGFRNSDDVVATTIRGFHERGVFDDAAVAVVAAVADKSQVESIALPLLDELGVDVVDVSFIEASALDTAASEAEAALIAERQKTAGADVALAIGGGTPSYAGGLEDSDFRPRLATTSLSSLRAYIRDRGGRDLSLLEDSVAGNIAEQVGWWADSAIQDCIAIVEAAGEPTILDPNTRAPEEPENIVSVAAACRDVALFVAIATAAGPELTNDSFRAAGEGLGDFHVPGFGPATYRADRPDGGAPIYFYEWDDELQDLATDGTTL